MTGQDPEQLPEPQPGQPPYGQPYGGAPQQPGHGYQPYAGSPQPQGYGYPPGWGGFPPPPPPSDGRALASMIVGIVALGGMCAYGVPLLAAPVAFFLGLSARRRIDASEGRLGGRGYAQTGIITGIIGTILLLLLVALVVVLVALSVNGTIDWDDSSSSTEF